MSYWREIFIFLEVYGKKWPRHLGQESKTAALSPPRVVYKDVVTLEKHFILFIVMSVYVVPRRNLLGLNIGVFRAVDFSFVNTNHTYISILGPELSDIIIHKHLNTMETKMV